MRTQGRTKTLPGPRRAFRSDGRGGRSASAGPGFWIGMAMNLNGIG
jgi:hypothetical protein